MFSMGNAYQDSNDELMESYGWRSDELRLNAFSKCWPLII